MYTRWGDDHWRVSLKKIKQSQERELGASMPADVLGSTATELLSLCCFSHQAVSVRGSLHTLLVLLLVLMPTNSLIIYSEIPKRNSNESQSLACKLNLLIRRGNVIWFCPNRAIKANMFNETLPGVYWPWYSISTRYSLHLMESLGKQSQDYNICKTAVAFSVIFPTESHARVKKEDSVTV